MESITMKSNRMGGREITVEYSTDSEGDVYLGDVSLGGEELDAAWLSMSIQEEITDEILGRIIEEAEEARIDAIYRRNFTKWYDKLPVGG